MNKDLIKINFHAFINNHGGMPDMFYVGIASNPDDRISEHKADHNLSLYSDAENAIIAREIEKYFIDKVGTDGAPGGGDDSTRFVYIYMKTPDSDP